VHPVHSQRRKDASSFNDSMQRSFWQFITASSVSKVTI